MVWISSKNKKEYYLKGTEGGKARREITKFLVTRIMKKNSRFNRPNGIVEAEIELELTHLSLQALLLQKELRSVEYFKKALYLLQYLIGLIP